MTRAARFSPGRFLAAGFAITALAMLASPSAAAGWTAGGNEPSWQVALSETEISFSTLEGERLVIEPLPEPARAEDVEVYSGRAGAETFTLVATEKICTDSMSGMPHPKTVVVALGERVFLGCGGDPLSLLLGEWRVEEIDGQPVMAGPEPSLGFDLDGSVHGHASCNRFFGVFTLTGEGLSLSPAGLTRMACEEGVMAQEQRFVAALENVVRFERGSSGELQLFGAEGNAVLRARQ